MQKDKKRPSTTGEMIDGHYGSNGTGVSSGLNSNLMVGPTFARGVSRAWIT